MEICHLNRAEDYYLGIACDSRTISLLEVEAQLRKVFLRQRAVYEMMDYS